MTSKVSSIDIIATYINREKNIISEYINTKSNEISFNLGFNVNKYFVLSVLSPKSICEKSGEERSESEGKKYISNSWNLATKICINFIKTYKNLINEYLNDKDLANNVEHRNELIEENDFIMIYLNLNIYCTLSSATIYYHDNPYEEISNKSGVTIKKIKKPSSSFCTTYNHYSFDFINLLKK